MLKEYLKVMRNYVNFSGRATRREYWSFVCINVIVVFASALVAAIPYWFAGTEAIVTRAALLSCVVAFWAYLLATFIPWLAVSVRRLHDINKGAGWLLLLLGMALLPFITLLPLLFMAAQPSYPYPNKYGNPDDWDEDAYFNATLRDTTLPY